MEWKSLYRPDTEPSYENISQYIGSDLWGELNSLLQETYKTAPKRTYSKETGWTVKYQKSGKSLCTLYPREGYFVALIVIGNKETPETELVLPELSDYVKLLYAKTVFLCGGKWLMISVTSANIMKDVMQLIGIRARAK